MIILEQGQVLDSFDAFAIDNVAGTVYALPAQAVLVTWQTSFGSAPVAINIIIETSLDNVSWSTVATTTDTGGETGSFNTSAIFIRSSIVSHTGGDTVTVQLVSKTALLGIIDPQIVTDGSLVIFSGTSGSQFGELPFSGVVTEFLNGTGAFSEPFDQELNTTDDVVFNSVTSAFVSSDASAGLTQDVTTGALVGKTMTFKDGILTGFA
jgi:hypothetical protein